MDFPTVESVHLRNGCDAMVVSMTGFGRATVKTANFSVIVEVKSVNHRFCEISARIPRQLLAIEDKMKKAIGEYVRRGRIELFVTVDGEGFVKKALEIDWSLMDSYVDAIKQANNRYSSTALIDTQHILTLDGVVSIVEVESGNSEIEAAVLEAIHTAAEQLKSMRQAEGQELFRDITKYINELQTYAQHIQEHAPNVVIQYQERINKRVQEFVGDVIDASRILTEVALFSDRTDISEEITRINSHIIQFLETLQINDTIGRKLDFLVQELNREVNTIGSKANDHVISQYVVEMKSLLEKIREQIQNIE